MDPRCVDVVEDKQTTCEELTLFQSVLQFVQKQNIEQADNNQPRNARVVNSIDRNHQNCHIKLSLKQTLTGACVCLIFNFLWIWSVLMITALPIKKTIYIASIHISKQLLRLSYCHYQTKTLYRHLQWIKYESMKITGPYLALYQHYNMWVNTNMDAWERRHSHENYVSIGSSDVTAVSTHRCNVHGLGYPQASQQTLTEQDTVMEDGD